MELKPCPFCGGESKMKCCDGHGDYFAPVGTPRYMGRDMKCRLVVCEKCGIKTKPYMTARGAFNAWNRRANDDSKRHYCNPIHWMPLPQPPKEKKP